MSRTSEGAVPMSLFVTVLEGSSPDVARTILATRHPQIVEATLREVRRCLNLEVGEPDDEALAHHTGPRLVEHEDEEGSHDHD